MVGTVSFSGTTYAELPLKFEAGTTNYIGAIGLAEAIGFLNGLDLHAATAYETMLKDYAEQQLGAIDGLRIYGTQPDKCSIVSFGAEGVHPYDIGVILDKLGIAIRTGTHAAEPVMTHYGITSMARASFAFYNTREEVDRLAEGVTRAAHASRITQKILFELLFPKIMALIVLEGLDGAGKSTQVNKLQQMLASCGIGYEYLHFPRFDAPVYGELIARFLRGELGEVGAVDPYIVALLYAGDRPNAAPMIRNWLDAGKCVSRSLCIFECSLSVCKNFGS